MWQCTRSSEKLWSVIKHPSKATTASFLCCTAHQEQRQQLYSRSSPSKTAPRKLQPFVDQENLKKSKKNKIKKKEKKKSQHKYTAAEPLWEKASPRLKVQGQQLHLSGKEIIFYFLLHPPECISCIPLQPCRASL